jgi:hypothetical protein
MLRTTLFEHKFFELSQAILNLIKLLRCNHCYHTSPKLSLLLVVFYHRAYISVPGLGILFLTSKLSLHIGG